MIFSKKKLLTKDQIVAQTLYDLTKNGLIKWNSVGYSGKYQLDLSGFHYNTSITVEEWDGPRKSTVLGTTIALNVNNYIFYINVIDGEAKNLWRMILNKRNDEYRKIEDKKKDESLDLVIKLLNAILENQAK